MRHSLAAAAASGIVLVVSLGFYGLSRSVVSTEPRSTYMLHAIFLSSDGLAPGADIRIAGVKIGEIESIRLDLSTFTSDVALALDANYTLPQDSSLRVGSSGFTSAAYLDVDPGRSGSKLHPGSTVRDTHAMVSLEQSVSQYIFGADGLGENVNR